MVAAGASVQRSPPSSRGQRLSHAMALATYLMQLRKNGAVVDVAFTYGRAE